MYYVVIEDKDAQKYWNSSGSVYGINNAEHFSQDEYEKNEYAVRWHKFVFIKIMDDGTKMEILT